MRSLVEPKAIYDALGFVVIPKVFTEIEMVCVRREAYHYWAYAELMQRQYRGDYKRLFFWPSWQSSYLRSIAHDSRVKDIVRTFLGSDVFQLNNQVYFREAGDDDQFAWHQDICFRTPREEFQNVESMYLQTLVVVDPMTSDNGAIEFIPRSHLQGDLNLIPRDDSEAGLRVFVRGEREGVKVVAQPGDMVLWHPLTVHGSERNTSNTNRMTYMNGFAHDSAVLNKTRFPRYDVDFKPAVESAFNSDGPTSDKWRRA